MPIDAKHGRFIPLGGNLARLLRAFLRQMGNVVRSRPGQRPDLSRFAAVMVQELLPLFRIHFQRGQSETIRRIRATLAARKPKRKGVFATVTKAPNLPPIATTTGGPGEFQISFDVFLPQVEMMIQQMTMQFVRSTLATAQNDVATAYQLVRMELAEGLSEGETLRELNERIGRIFDDPVRAHRIAMTEASRAMHAGQMESAKESGIVEGLRWLASSDACPLCLKLDGKEVPLGTPFYVDPRGGPYATVYHPPAHPHCMCSTEEVL